MKKQYRQNTHSPAGCLALLAPTAFLGAAMWYASTFWAAMPGVHMSSFGWASLVLGVVFAIGLGVGLMRLWLYSSRHDMDR